MLFYNTDYGKEKTREIMFSVPKIEEKIYRIFFLVNRGSREGGNDILCVFF